jgi:hypothetical protein
MITLGIILLIIGFVAGITILWTLGVMLLVIGLVLAGTPWVVGGTTTEA